MAAKVCGRWGRGRAGVTEEVLEGRELQVELVTVVLREHFDPRRGLDVGPPRGGRQGAQDQVQQRRLACQGERECKGAIGRRKRGASRWSQKRK